MYLVVLCGKRGRRGAFNFDYSSPSKRSSTKCPPMYNKYSAEYKLADHPNVPCNSMSSLYYIIINSKH